MLQKTMKAPHEKAPEEKFNFFLKIHKSVLVPDFYRAIAGFSAKTVILFVVKMCLLTALISGCALTYYALDMKTGLPAKVPEMLPGMSFKNGMLDPGRQTPFIPSKASVSGVFETIFRMPGIIDDAPESLVVVDTALSRVSDKNFVSRVLLTAKTLEIQFNGTSPVRLSYPYSKWLRSADTVAFTPPGIRRFLMHNIAAVAVNFCVQSGGINTGIFLMSILFLGFAACIFRIDRQRSLGACFKMSCFAVSPMFIGVNLIAISGAQFPVAWHIMLIVSTIILVRGINAERRALLNDKRDLH
jgi:hypothetical protein